jgi:hypothetical protein
MTAVLLDAEDIECNVRLICAAENFRETRMQVASTIVQMVGKVLPG